MKIPTKTRKKNKSETRKILKNSNLPLQLLYTLFSFPAFFMFQRGPPCKHHHFRYNTRDSKLSQRLKEQQLGICICTYVYDFQTLSNAPIRQQRRFYWVSVGPELREETGTWRVPSSSGLSLRKRGSSSSHWLPPSLSAPACSPGCRTRVPLCNETTNQHRPQKKKPSPENTAAPKVQKNFEAHSFSYGQISQEEAEQTRD